MASITSQLIVRLVDQVSGPATAAGNALRRLVAQSNARGGAGLTALGQQLQTIQTRAQQVGQRATAAVASAAVPAAIGVAAAYRAALGYSQELNYAAGIGELTAAQQREVAKTAREIGASTQFTATQAVAMQRALIAAGRTVEQAQGMTRPILNTALAGRVDPEAAADGIIAIASAYRVAMPNIETATREATRIGDIVARAANESRANFGDILQGFKYAAPMANAAGFSMHQLAAAIAHMANNGLRGDEAGVALRSMLVRMVKPTQDARQAMAELGLSFDQFFGRMKEFNMSNFNSGMRNLGHRFSAVQQQQIQAAVARNAARPEGERQDLGVVLTEATIKALGIAETRTQDRQKIARAVQRHVSSLMEGANPDGLFEALQQAGATPGHMSRIFDARQGSRLMTLMGPQYQEILAKLRQYAAGSSERMAARMEEGLYGAHMRVKSAIEAIILSIAESGIADKVAEVMTKIAVALRSMSETDPGRLRAIGYALMALAAAAPVGLTLIGVAAVFKTVAAAASLLAAVMAPLAAPILAVGAALAGLAVYAYRNWDGLTSFASSFAATIAEKFPHVAAAIGWVGTKLGELAGWFDGLIGKSSASTEQWAAWGRAAATAVSDAVDAVTNGVARIGSQIASGWETVRSTMVSVATSIGNGIIDAVQTVPDRVRGIIEGGFSGAAEWFSGLSMGVADKAAEVIATLQALPGRIAAIFSTVGGLLYEAGARMMQSLLDGIKAKVAELIAYVSAIPGRITGALGGIRLPSFGGGGAPAGATQGPARAGGGRVNAGTVYGVGERGREIFVPDSNGTVLGNRGRASGGGTGQKAGGVVQHNTFNVSVTGGADGAATAEKIRRALVDEFAKATRSISADYGPAFT